MSRRSTTRILELVCPMCGRLLHVHVRGLKTRISGEAWLDIVDVRIWQFIHDEHERTGESIISTPLMN